MKTYFRLQLGHYTFEQMENYQSEDGGDGMAEEGGLCACDSVTDLTRNTVWPLWNERNAEVVVFQGHKVCDIYDGARVTPVKEIARYSGGQFKQMVEDGTAYDHEAW